MGMSYAYGVIPDKKEMVSLLDAVVERGVTLASQLHLSPKYLSDLLKQETGKAALELINLYVFAEAKNRLVEGKRRSLKLPIILASKISLAFLGCSKRKWE